MKKLLGCLSVMVFSFFTHEVGAEYVVGEEAVIQFQLDRQTSQSKCNIRVTLADGSNIDVQIDPPSFVASLRFTPSIAGKQVIQWEGKTKFRGLKSTGGCSGSGSFAVEVRDRAEVIAERERARKAEEARQREEAVEAKYKPWADYVASLSGDIRECMLEGNHLLIENTRVYDDIMPLMRAVAELEIDGEITNGGQMLGYFVESCKTFISTERQWTGQSWGDPPAEVSCISPQSARCIPFYIVETDTDWAKATWRDALKAHLNDKPWDTALEETAESFKQRCEQNPLVDSSCPGYAGAKAEQDRIEAERKKERQRIAAEKEKERQKELAQQRKREEEQRKRGEQNRSQRAYLADPDMNAKCSIALGSIAGSAAARGDQTAVVNALALVKIIKDFATETNSWDDRLMSLYKNISVANSGWEFEQLPGCQTYLDRIVKSQR